MDQQPRNILITGASSGIGAALAEIYAASGVALYLGGRDEARLSDLAGRCETAGASCQTAAIDVTDSAAMKAWVEASDAQGPLDLVIANAGISAGTGFAGESPEQTRRIMETNVDGAFNTVLPVLPAMVKRKRGQVAVMSSLASFRGFPGAPAYCASKATLRLWGEGQRVWLRQHSVKLSVICPGFVRTPMSDNNPYPMPFLMDAERSARIIKRGLARNKARIAFPWQTYWLAQLVTMLPLALTDALLAKTPSKPSEEG
jgi:short-subunit dehydrogenase